MTVFVIESPFQVMNAIEAVHHFKFEDNVIIVLLSGLFSKESYERIIDKKQWKEVRYVPFRYKLTNSDFGLHPPKNVYERMQELYLTLDRSVKKKVINNMCRSLGRVDNLVLGSYRRYYDIHMRHIANNVDHNRLFLIDVGTDTLEIGRQRIEEHNAGPGALGDEPAKSLKSMLRDKLVEWDGTGVDSLTFFTSYDFEVSGPDRVIKNDYRYFKSLADRAAVSDGVWFIAQPLVEQEYLTHDVYVRYLAKVKQYFSGRPVFYIPHPRESGRYIELARNEFGFETKRFDVPIEYAVTVGGSRPQCIASFFSSALENFAVIFGNRIDIKAFYLHGADLLKNHESVHEVYSHYVSKGMDIEVVS